MIYHPSSAHSNGGARGSRRNSPVSAARCVSFRFGLGRKYDISPPGAITSPNVGCLRLQAPASLLPQMDESPPFHEIALEYLQNDLFPLSLSPRCINSFRTRREDAMRAALPPGPRATPHPSLRRLPRQGPHHQRHRPPRFRSRETGKGKARRHPPGDARITIRGWLAAKPLRFHALGHVACPLLWPVSPFP